MGNIGDNIKKYRLQSGLTLLEVANKLGVKEATVQRYESGKIQNIKYDTIVALGKIFDVDPSLILGWEETEKQPMGYEHWKKFKDIIDTMTDEEKKSLMDYMNFIISQRK